MTATLTPKERVSQVVERNLDRPPERLVNISLGALRTLLAIANEAEMQLLSRLPDHENLCALLGTFRGVETGHEYGPWAEPYEDRHGVWWTSRSCFCCGNRFFKTCDPPTTSSKTADRTTVVCLCGSTRFMDAFREASRRLSLEGKIVLSAEIVTYDGATDPQRADPEQKRRLDELHLRKIDLADEVLVLNVGGYIGDSTRQEIAYARRLNKTVTYLEEVPDA